MKLFVLASTLAAGLFVARPALACDDDADDDAGDADVPDTPDPPDMPDIADVPDVPDTPDGADRLHDHIADLERRVDALESARDARSDDDYRPGDDDDDDSNGDGDDSSSGGDLELEL